MDALISKVHEDCRREEACCLFVPSLLEYVVKTCRCCRRDYTEASWAKLARVGLMSDGEGGALSLRNCVCGSTLAMPLVMQVTS
jgi:hypothetical protein